MHLKKLTLCLLGLSLSACSTHVIKNNALGVNKDTPQRAIEGFNALYETPSFDYRGQIKVQLHSTQNNQNSTQADAKKLDPVVEQKVNQYLKEQKITLTETQKKELYQALAKQDTKYFKDILGKGADYVQSILNDLQIQYDGSVNYRQKIASFNLDTKYKKPNLAVEMRIPTIIDLNNYRFYTHIFSLMPYLANPQDQDKYAYFDFSKYKDDIAKVNGKALVELLKQSGATTYLLAQQNQIENISVSSAEKQAGVVEKIRLHTTLEELFLQGNLYTTVNRQYFMNSVLGLSQSNIAKLQDRTGESESDTESTILGSDDSATDATSAMYKLYEAVNHQTHEDSDEDEDVEGEKHPTASDRDDESEDSEYTDEDESDEDAESSEKILTEQQCEDLAKTKANVRFGDVEYCQYHYEVDVLSANVEENSPLEGNTLQKQNHAELEKKFAAYGKAQLVDAEQFKQLWNQHSAEIEASLPPKNKRNPLIVDLSLDAKGRAFKADYDLGMDFEKQKRKLNIKMDMQISNYGNASKIDQQALKEAKSFKEIFKGSFMEKAVGGFAGASSEKDQDSEQKYLSLDERLAQLAEQVFTQTASYEKTYKAVFIAKLTAEKPELIKQYSAQDLQEIAAVYAYSYSDEEVYNPTGQALKQIEALKKKHHLEDDHQYDDELGNAIDEIVIKAKDSKQSVLEIQSLVKKYKTAEAVFAQYYMQKFEAENELEKAQRAEFVKTSQVLAKSYTALKNNQFNDSVVASLNENSAEFIDYDLFKQTYQIVSDAKLK